MHPKILQLISQNEQDLAGATEWMRMAPEEVKCYIWQCIQDLGEPEGEDADTDKLWAVVSRFAQLGFALVAERVYSRK